MSSSKHEVLAETHENEVADYSEQAERVHPVSEAFTVRTAPGPASTDLALNSSKKLAVIGIRNRYPAVGAVVEQTSPRGNQI